MTHLAPDISVVICAYTEERWEDLTAAVASVQRQTTPPSEIVVVIDHNPTLFERARAHMAGVRVIENSEPPGDAGVRNCGAAAARGAIIVFLDDDAVAAPDWLGWLAEGYRDGRALGVGGTIEPVWPGNRPSWFPEEFDWVVGCTYRGLPQVRAPVRNLIGANMSFRREVFETTIGFRTRLARVGTQPVGDHETELCVRALRYYPGKVFLYVPEAKVYHRVQTNRVNWTYFRSRCFAEGRSKHLMSTFVGTRDGLACERSYTLRTLPLGIVRNITDAFATGDRTRLARAGAIVAGLTITTAGYATEMWVQHVAKRHEAGAPHFSLSELSGRRIAMSRNNHTIDGKAAPQDGD